MANLSGYNFAYLDEQTKRMIRRAILKAVAIPGYQVPFGLLVEVRKVVAAQISHGSAPVADV